MRKILRAITLCSMILVIVPAIASAAELLGRLPFL
jgi:hypothetical protein